MSVIVPGCLCAGHPAGNWGNMGGGLGKQGPVEPHSSSNPLHPFLSLLSYSFALLLSLPILFSFLSSISQQGIISCDPLKPIISQPLSNQPLNSNRQPFDQSPRRTGSLIDAYQRIHCCSPVLPIPVIMCAVVIANLSLYCISVLLVRNCFCSIPNNLQ